MRMRCLRILPEMAASTTCSLLSSWTLKNALGCLSIIVPSAGIKSSLDNTFSFVNTVCLSLTEARPLRRACSVYQKPFLTRASALSSRSSWTERTREDAATSARHRRRGFPASFTTSLCAPESRRHDPLHILSSEPFDGSHRQLVYRRNDCNCFAAIAGAPGATDAVH